MRTAIINQLKDQVAGLGGRVYQAFLAPANVQKPYATVKMAGERGDLRIPWATHPAVEVRLYNEKNSFIPLDALEKECITALNGVSLNGKHQLRWVPGGTDFEDIQLGLIGRLINFRATVINE